MERRKGTRQACDLWYKKKIKCDTEKPRCGHCVVYGVECTYGAASRKVVSKKQASREEGDLRSRMDRLEAQIRLVTEKVDKLESVGHPEAAISQSSVTMEEEVRLPGESLKHVSMELPPLEEVLPVIEKYLATFNPIIPLFHPKTLLHTVKKWYWHPHQREHSTWAAINVALGLAYRQSESIPNKSIAQCLHNTQSVLTQVIMGDVNLINVQVLVGLVMLLQGMRDLTPPVMLIATALRLAHKLGLHTRASSMGLDQSEALQRDRVFWIAYILDKDISMRTRQPPIQLDADIDLELPPEEPTDDDDVKFFFTTDGRSTVNFFRIRVQLAHIQGGIYDCLYSSRSQRLSPEERAENAQYIQHMLVEWESHIPDAFSPISVSQTGLLDLSRCFCILYCTRLSCLALISRAHPWDSPWLQDLQDYGRKTAAGQAANPVPLPQSWQTLVDESRDVMMLFTSVPSKDSAFVWMTVCAYFSGLICLTANNMHNPHHDAMEHDTQLVDTALTFFDEMLQQTNHEDLCWLRDSCRELNQHALAIVQKERRGEMTAYSHYGDGGVLPPILVGKRDASTLPARERPVEWQVGNPLPSWASSWMPGELANPATGTVDCTGLNDMEFGPDNGFENLD